MKKTWSIRKDAEAVSPVIATILMVAITVVLAAVLYVMVLGFNTGTNQTPAAVYNKTSATGGGAKILIVSITRNDVSWDDVKVQLQAPGGGFSTWTTVAADLDGGVAITKDYGVQGGYSLNVTDLAGNGIVSGSDFLTITGTFATGTFVAALIYVPTGEMVGTGASFQM